MDDRENLLVSMWADVYKRPFITVGFTAFIADDSAGGHVDGRDDPPARRTPLEPAAPARLRRRRSPASLHYWWLVKADIRRPEAYALVVGTLLAFRVWWTWGRSTAPAHARAAAKPAQIAE